MNADNITSWIGGHGDLPTTLVHFELTLPHWGDGAQPSPSFVALRDRFCQEDEDFMARKGVKPESRSGIGFKAFAQYMEKRTEQMFAQCIGPVLQSLRDSLTDNQDRLEGVTESIDETDDRIALNTVRECGQSFAEGLKEVMEGQIHEKDNDSQLHQNLERELRSFHELHTAIGSNFNLLPLEDYFTSIDEYLKYLREDIKIDSYKFEVSGGAQWKRMLDEIELFVRFSEMNGEVKKQDVVQARGVAVGAVTWREVIIKLLSHSAHLPMKDRIRYAGERIKFFFSHQKEVTLNWMLSLKGSAQEHLHPKKWTKHSRTMQTNEMIRHLVYEAYDQAVDRQLSQFLELFNNTLASTFSNPWVFLKKTSMSIDEKATLADVMLPTWDETKKRIPREIDERSGIETYLNEWITQVDFPEATAGAKRPMPSATAGPAGAMCKNNCGRPVAEGVTRSGRPYDTCCACCGRSGGASTTRLASPARPR